MLQEKNLNQIVNKFETEIKKHHIRGMVQGQEIIAQMMLDFVNDGKDLLYIKNYCESLLKSSKDGTMEKVANKEKGKE